MITQIPPDETEADAVSRDNGQKLQNLPNYLRKVLPDPEFISNVEIREGIQAVLFRWHGVHFLVDPTLRVLEVRDRKLYLSNLTTLLQTILTRRRKKELLFSGVIERLNEAERLIWTRPQAREGLGLVDTVKVALEREID